MKPMKKIAMATTARTTWPGEKNLHGQEVVRKTGARSESHPNQRVYHIRCSKCRHEYGANGCDLHLRRCPSCQGGAAGEALRVEAHAGLFDGL
jgi:hypothetical protein